MKERSLQVELTEPLQRQKCFISKTFLDICYVAFRVTSKGALPPISPHRALTETERERHSVYRALFYCLSPPSPYIVPNMVAGRGAEI
jgi:hypothetical protein